MKNEPVSISILLRPLKPAMPQNIRRQETRNAVISDLGASWSTAEAEPSENNFRRVVSINSLASLGSCPIRDSVTPSSKVRRPATKARMCEISKRMIPSGGSAPRLPRSVMAVPPGHSPLGLPQLRDGFLNHQSATQLLREMKIGLFESAHLDVFQRQRVGRTCCNDSIVAALRCVSQDLCEIVENTLTELDGILTASACREIID